MKTTEVETKTTQGPWKVEKFQRDDGSGFAVTTADEDKTVVAWLYQHAPNSFGRVMRSPQNHSANAKLIAAAPDMLDSLVYIAKLLANIICDQDQPENIAYHEALKAINKATK